MSACEEQCGVGHASITWLFPDVRKPVLTVHTGPGVEGELVIQTVEGKIVFEEDSGLARTV